MDDLISIIIPVYNAADTLKRCVESVRSQSFSNLDIILVDDGSTDGSGALCDALAEEDTRIQVIHKSNEGPGLARRDGCRAAGGTYIAFVDSDDYIKDDMLQTMLEVITSKQADIVRCGFYKTDELGNILSRHDNTAQPEVIGGTPAYAKAHVNIKNLRSIFCNNLFRAALFGDITYPPLYFCEDTCVLAQLYANAMKIVTIRDPLYYYVKSDKSLTGSGFSTKRLDTVRAGKFIYKFYEDRFPELRGYAASYICFVAAKCYCQAIPHDFDEKEEILQDLLCDFKRYYKKIGDVFRDHSIRTRAVLLLFNLSPGLCCKISKRYYKSSDFINSRIPKTLK